MKCRFCGKKLEHEFLDLGHAPPSNSFLTKEKLSDPEIYYPLKVMVCSSCFLVQIDEHKSCSEIFCSDYVYFSSNSSTWLEHCRIFAENSIRKFGLNQNSLVMEVASNDGYLLQFFKKENIPVLGIEPSCNTALAAQKKGIETITEFFGMTLAQKLIEEGKQADLLTGNNVLAHVPDINDFVLGLHTVLKPSGVLTMEFPHLKQLVEKNQFDTVYHEHYSYLSLSTVNRIFEKNGLRIFCVEELPTHGGSLRIYACRNNSSIETDPSVNKMLETEKNEGLLSLEYYRNFKKQCEKVRHDFLEFLIKASREGKKVAGYGAAAKGNTLLNYCGVRSDLISFVVDRAESKQGKFLPGSHIPVVEESLIRQEKPDYIIIFPWNLKTEITAQLAYTRDWGARFIIPIPQLSII